MRGFQRAGVPVPSEVLAAAYDAFYAEGDPDPIPHELRRERAARFDAKWA